MRRSRGQVGKKRDRSLTLVVARFVTSIHAVDASRLYQHSGFRLSSEWVAFFSEYWMAFAVSPALPVDPTPLQNGVQRCLAELNAPSHCRAALGSCQHSGFRLSSEWVVSFGEYWVPLPCRLPWQRTPLRCKTESRNTLPNRMRLS